MQPPRHNFSASLSHPVYFFPWSTCAAGGWADLDLSTCRTEHLSFIWHLKGREHARCRCHFGILKAVACQALIIASANCAGAVNIQTR